MNNLFLCYEDFNQSIGNWDVGNVIDMSGMFYSECAASNFNQDISHWDVSSVINMNYMFGGNAGGGGDVKPRFKTASNTWKGVGGAWETGAAPLRHSRWSGQRW